MEVVSMFNDAFLQKIFSNEEMQLIPVGFQATAVKVFENELSKLKEENKNATLSAILSDAVSAEFTEPNTESTESASAVSSYVESAEYEPTEYESSTNYDY